MNKTFIVTGWLNDEQTSFNAYSRQEADELAWELQDEGYEDVSVEEIRI